MKCKGFFWSMPWRICICCCFRWTEFTTERGNPILPIENPIHHRLNHLSYLSNPVSMTLENPFLFLTNPYSVPPSSISYATALPLWPFRRPPTWSYDKKRVNPSYSFHRYPELADSNGGWPSFNSFNSVCLCIIRNIIYLLAGLN